MGSDYNIIDMEGNYLTAGDLALMEQHRGGRGMAATGIGLAAGLGGAALLGVIIAAWGTNQASKARSEGAMNAINLLAARQIQDKSEAAGITLDIQQTLRNSSQATGGTASALAQAEALALLQNNSGLSSAVANSSYLRVQPISVQDCGCGCGQ